MKDFQIETLGCKVEDIVNQVNAIRDFPCMIYIYDRMFRIDTKAEAWTFSQGLEVGHYYDT